MAARPAKKPRGTLPEEGILHIAELEWQKTFDSINDGICVLSLDQKILRCNRAMASLFDRKREELVGRYCYEIVHGTTAPPPECPIPRMRKSLMRETMELRRGNRWFDVTVDPVLDDAGELSSILHIVRDITQKKRAEAAHRDALAFNSEIISGAGEGIIVYDSEFRYVVWNRFMVDLTGSPQASVLGKNAFDLFPHLKEQGIDKLLERALSGETVSSPDMHFSNPATGVSGWTIGIYAPHRNAAGEIIGVIGLIRDITERKKAEESLRESEEKYRVLAETSPEMIYLIDGEGVVRYVNNISLAMFKGGRDAVVGKHLSGLYPPDMAERHLKVLKGVVGSGRPFYAEMIEEFPAGPCWIDVRLTPVRNDKGKITGVLGLSQDITQRKKAEESLRLTQFAIDHASDAAFWIDADAHFVYANNAACKSLGYTREELLSMTLHDVDPDLSPAAWPDNWKEVKQKGYMMIESRQRTKEGKLFPVEVSINYFEFGGKGYGFAFIRDITERKKTEEELARREKLDALGVIAGGIAHDFNNLLGGIFGFMDLTRMTLKPGEPAIDYLNKAFSAFERAKGLSRQLLTFSKGGVPVKKTVRVETIVADCCNLALSGSNVKCAEAIPEGLLPVEADEHQLAQVFSNIIINARQAMPEGGTITVSAENKHIKENSGPFSTGSYVAVAFKDEGIGIPEKIIDRIFDPFFTTKQQGSGLGLAICYSIVKQHGGHIDVVSLPGGEGSTFTVWLPASPGEVTRSADQETGRSLAGSGRMLFMDDEPELCEMVGAILTGAGYSVVAVPNGRTAIEKYRKAMDDGVKFDLVILDLTVPGGMGGEKTVAALQKIDPGVVACVSSGYADSAVIAHPEEYGFAATIAKPYYAKDLLRMVKTVLEKKKK